MALVLAIHNTGEEINVLRLPKFDYFEPRSLEEASTLLIKGKGSLRVLAGGTDLLVKMKEQKVKYLPVVDDYDQFIGEVSLNNIIQEYSRLFLEIQQKKRIELS